MNSNKSCSEGVTRKDEVGASTEYTKSMKWVEELRKEHGTLSNVQVKSVECLAEAAGHSCKFGCVQVMQTFLSAPQIQPLPRLWETSHTSTLLPSTVEEDLKRISMWMLDESIWERVKKPTPARVHVDEHEDWG